MKITVQVKVGCKVEGVEFLDDGSYLVRVRARPVDGEANKRVLEVLAAHFDTPKSRVNLVSGLKSRRKIFEVK